MMIIPHRGAYLSGQFHLQLLHPEFSWIRPTAMQQQTDLRLISIISLFLLFILLGFRLEVKKKKKWVGDTH